MAVKSDNLNLNLNLNLGAAAAGAGAGLGRPRFNTEDFPKTAVLPAVPTALDDNLAAIPAFSHRPDWDAEGRAWLQLSEFTSNLGAGANKGPFQTWLTDVVTFLDANAPAIPGNLPPIRCPAGPHANKLTLAELNTEIAGLVDASLDRGDRLQEIVDQADGEGAINYWTGMLALNPATQPNTHLLIRVGRKIGELVAMRLKGIYMCPRPSRIHPLIVPAIDPPDTPSFPSSHATQAYLISGLLIEAINPPLIPGPPITQPAHLKSRTFRRAVLRLADRVAENRTVAGLHYPVDTRAGMEVALKCFQRVLNCPTITGVIGGANNENK